jgi:ribonuclease Z
MTTTVTLTGTGVPMPAPGRAGPGALVRFDDIALQFDSGRATTQRLVDLGVDPHALTAMFITHVHSDHVVDLPDVAITRWLQQSLYPTGPLVVVAPQGAAATFVEHMLDPYHDDITLRVTHTGSAPPRIDLRQFPVTPQPSVVWASDDGRVTVEAVGVHHEPVLDAVAYRVMTPDGVVVISGDTRVCDEVEELSRGADLLVHEACRTSAMRNAIAGTVFETIFSYHADTPALGAMAQRAGVPHLVLTHLIPPPANTNEEHAFATDVRDGGYTGRVTVGSDLYSVDVVEAAQEARSVV